MADLFDEPESFKPERYLESAFGTKAKADASEFRHNFPFGAGRVSLFIDSNVIVPSYHL